jgi:carboxyl-terminal processing protease
LIKHFILYLSLLVTVLSFGQTDKTFCETLQSINSLIQQEHYNAKKVDDSLSVYVFNTFLDKLDQNNSVFIASDIAALKKHQYKIDDYITSNNCEFINDFYTTYRIAVNRLNNIIESIKNEPLPYIINDKLNFSKKKLPYVTSEKDLKYLYKKSILFLILKDVALTSTNKDSLVKVFNTTANTTKIKTLDKYSCKSNKLNISQNDLYTQFFSVFCSYFDPHSDFFTKTDKSTFLSSVSADNLTFGMDVSFNDDDEIIVNQILPGSDAYFSEKIEVKDQILKIKYQKEEFNIACSNEKKNK